MAGRHDSLLQRRARPGLAGGPRRLRLESQRCPRPFRPELARVGAARDQALLATTAASVTREATVGYVAQATIELPRIDESSQLCNSYSSAHAVAHELGHVLGLGHEERGCALMNGRGTWSGAQHCRQEAVWTWRCGLLEPDDINGVVSALRRPHEHHEPRLVFRVCADPRAAEPLGRAPGRRDRRAALRPARTTGDASLPRRSDAVSGRLGDRARRETPARRRSPAQSATPGASASASRWRWPIGCLSRAAIATHSGRPTRSAVRATGRRPSGSPI